MKIKSAILVLTVLVATSASAKDTGKPSTNAALRYWSAFAQMRDSTISDRDAKEISLILDGSARYDDAKYKELVEQNRPALETMARASELPNCDWGAEYQLGEDTPVDYVRKALALGRLNVLYAFRLMLMGDRDQAARALKAGLRFSHDVANGGTLFATVVAKDLLEDHLRALASVLPTAGFSFAQKSTLQNTIAQLGKDGLDWSAAMKRELEVTRSAGHLDSVPMGEIATAYMTALINPSSLTSLQQKIASAPQPLRDAIPNPKRVLDEKLDLTDRLSQTRALLR